MLSEIFFYILKSLEKKDKNTKWEKLSEEHYKGNVFINL